MPRIGKKDAAAIAVKVREAEYGEARAIKEVARAHPYTAHFAHPAYCNRQRFERGENIVAVQLFGPARGQIIGMASLRFKKRLPETEIDIIAVSTGDRSRGVGRQLLDYIKKKSPHPRLVLNVMYDNTKAIAFYRREGFVSIGDALDGKAMRMVLEWQAKDERQLELFQAATTTRPMVTLRIPTATPRSRKSTGFG